MADDYLLTQALEAFDVYVVGELADGRRLMSRDGRTPVDDTVVFVEDAPDMEMSVVDAEREFGSILWMMEPEVATMAAAVKTDIPAPTPTPEPETAGRTVNFSDRVNQSDFVILAEARARDAANQPPAMTPDTEQPVVEMPAPQAPMEDKKMMPTEQAAVEGGDMTEPSPEEIDEAMAEGGAEEPAAMSEADVQEFGQMLSEAEKRVDQLEGLVATMVMDEVRDETFDQMGGTEQVMPDAKVGSVIQIAYEFGDLSTFLARVAAVGETEVTPDMEERLSTLVDRLEKLEATISDMMNAEVEDEELEDEEEDELPESEQTVIDETAPQAPTDSDAKRAAFFTNRRGVRVWHDPSTGKFAPAGFVSPKVLMKLWKGDAAAGLELDSAVRKARSANPEMDMDSVVAKVLGPVPTESMKRAYWEAGRRRVGRMWPATRGRGVRRPGDGEQYDGMAARQVDMARSDGERSFLETLNPKNQPFDESEAMSGFTQAYADEIMDLVRAGKGYQFVTHGNGLFAPADRYNYSGLNLPKTKEESFARYGRNATSGQDGDRQIDMARSDGATFPGGTPKKIDWPSELPGCDICGAPAAFDVPTSGSSRWANLCALHVGEFGGNTGIGFERVKPGMADPSPVDRMDPDLRQQMLDAGLTAEDMDLFDGMDIDLVEADRAAADEADDQRLIRMQDEMIDEAALEADAERRWQETLAGAYSDYLQDAQADGVTPMSLAEFEDDYVDGLVAAQEAQMDFVVADGTDQKLADALAAAGRRSQAQKKREVKIANYILGRFLRDMEEGSFIDLAGLADSPELQDTVESIVGDADVNVLAVTRMLSQLMRRY